MAKCFALGFVEVHCVFGVSCVVFVLYSLYWCCMGCMCGVSMAFVLVFFWLTEDVGVGYWCGLEVWVWLLELLLGFVWVLIVEFESSYESAV